MVRLLLSSLLAGLMLVGAPVTAQPDRDIAFPPDFDITTLQQRRPPPIDMGQRFSPGSTEPLAAPEFTFIRGRYENYPGGRTRRGGWWDTDFPDAERNFLRGVQRYTLINTDTSATRAMDLTDPALFENIFL